MIWIDTVSDAISYIEKNLFEPISAESVGKAVKYSPSTFRVIFRAVTGYSPGEYIRFRRLSWAADQIEGKLRSITEIAFECRFETVESFSKAYKRFFGYSPSRTSVSGCAGMRFSPIDVDLKVSGGFTMRRNLIPNLPRVDWADTQRQNEFVNSVVSALSALGENVGYDYVCAISGSAFRTSFAVNADHSWNHGNYHVINTPPIIEHTFRMLGYHVTDMPCGDFETDRLAVVESIDRGVPVVTIEGVIRNADACVISGYDNDGLVLLGYSPFMDIDDDHDEPPDDSGYFRKSEWHDEIRAGRIIIIGECIERPKKKERFEATLELMIRLIGEERMVPGQANGLAAHRVFIDTLQNGEWEDRFEAYLNVMCNEKQYLDRRCAARFFRENGRDDLGDVYERIARLSAELVRMIPQDFSAADMFDDRAKLRPFCSVLSKICDLEERALCAIR